ncbi:hypothetical protein FJTKL_12710 [Diaporthe vaccinii]|uniref:Uncharacterized protein n=1 Tax=Diaporthe vaccinii TaxID=105482 RepID=A0ABR4ECW5_9PEZI
MLLTQHAPRLFALLHAGCMTVSGEATPLRQSHILAPTTCAILYSSVRRRTAAIRYPRIFTITSLVSAAETYQILFTSPKNSQEGHAKLFNETACRTLLYDPNAHAQSTLKILCPRRIAVPSLHFFLDHDDEGLFPYQRSFSHVRNNPCLVLHTSGTTSFPKPIVLSHGQLAVFDAQWRIPSLKGRIHFLRAMASCSPFLVTMPFFHMAGFSMGIWLPLHPEMRVVFTDPAQPLSLLSIEKSLDSAPIGGAIVPPSILEEVATSKSAMKRFETLRYVFYGGAALSHDAGRAISEKTHLCSQIGSTECVVFATHLTDKSDWDYLCFGSDWSGYEFRPSDLPGIYEMILVRNDDKADFQAVFWGNNLIEFATGDLYSKHANKPNHWKHEGRLDDVIVFSNGEKLNPITNEKLIASHALVKSCMYVGNRRPQPAIILEMEGENASRSPSSEIIEAVWPLVEQANKGSPRYSQVQKSYVIITDASKPFLRTAKGGLKRAQTVELFDPEIRELYNTTVQASILVPPCDIKDRQGLQDFVLSVYKEATGNGPLHLDQDIFQLGADSSSIQPSISHLKACIFSLDINIDTSSITPRAVYANPTPRSMIEFLGRLLQPQDSSARTPVDRKKELQEVYVRYHVQLPAARWSIRQAVGTRSTVLLTGSTGNLGSYLLDVLLKRNDVEEVICLNRNKNAAENQVKSNSEKGLRADFNNQSVKFIHADLSQPQFGLDLSTYDYISSRTDIILHNQWPVNFSLSLASFEPQLQGMLNLIHFAAQAARQPKFCFVSSIGAVNNWRHQLSLRNAVHQVPEQHFTDLCLASNGYGESKAIASHLLYRATLQCRLRGMTIRLGQLAGPADSDHGMWNKTEWLPSLVMTSHELGALPQTIPLLTEVDWIPADRAAQVISELLFNTPMTRTDSVPGKSAIFNLANPRTVSWATLVPTIRSYLGNSCTIVSFREWLDLLEKMGRDERSKDATARLPALKLFDFFREMQEGHDRGAQQTLLSMESSMDASPSLARLGAVDGSMMVRWLRQWGLPSRTTAFSTVSSEKARL